MKLSCALSLSMLLSYANSYAGEEEQVYAAQLKKNHEKQCETIQQLANLINHYGQRCANKQIDPILTTLTLLPNKEVLLANFEKFKLNKIDTKICISEFASLHMNPFGLKRELKDRLVIYASNSSEEEEQTSDFIYKTTDKFINILFNDNLEVRMALLYNPDAKV